MVFKTMKNNRCIEIIDIYEILKKNRKTYFNHNGKGYIIKYDDTDLLLCDEDTNQKVARVGWGTAHYYQSEAAKKTIKKYERIFVFGYNTLEPYRNQGIMTRFVRHATDVILEEYESVVLIIETSNKYSEKVAIKNGYNHICDYIVYDDYFVAGEYTERKIPIYIKTKKTDYQI